MNRQIAQAKENYYKSYFSINFKNPRQTWRGLRCLMNNKKKQIVDQIKCSDGTILTDAASISREFNNFFGNVAQTLESDIPTVD